ncbi:ATP-dependent DNA helicase RecG [Candidatus Parcubacteria bacterium]|nr:ATP-dependent DNA helicase RecG [Candidatus Parcubacteria bacterium]
MELNSKLEEIFPRQPDARKKAFKKLGLKTVEDLLYYFPSRYGDTTELKNIKDLQVGDKPIIYAKIKSIKSGKGYVKKITMTEAVLEDATGTIQAVWFRQPYIAKMLNEGSFGKFQGTVSERNGKLYIANPEHRHINDIPLGTGDSLFNKENTDHFIYPVYPESNGISSKWIYHTVNKIFSSGLLDEIEDPIPQEILKKYKLPSIKTSLIWIHTPKKESDALSARKRFAFEEVFFIQLLRQKQKTEYQNNPSFKIQKTKEEVEKFINRFPFKLTPAQEKSINQILKDFQSNHAMSRLLEGDVGSGKTAVAATTVYAVATTKPNGENVGNLQTAYMAPTEILAKQLFESFIQYFSHLPINVGLITSNGCRKFPSKTNPDSWTDISRSQLLKWVGNGEIPILIGTHSLIQKTVKFKNLAYVIIDEQHRFGTNQRRKMANKEQNDETTEKNRVPHLLSMSATPIPRTLALTIYGDLDLTLLDQMPTGRKPIITEIVTPDKREKTYDFIKKELESGRQLYIICPRIDEPDPDKAKALRVKSVKAEAKRLKEEIFPNYEIDILHSKLKPTEKDDVMQDFLENKTNILVATSVVEVGVNVPNATMIIIEGAERFGLAQLHQLRGRIIRSNHQAYCFVFSDTKTKQTLERLKALKNAKNGFELAEFDLNLRGSGELSGKKQWGISDIGMEAIRNIKMVEAARTEAQEIIKKDFKLKNYPVIKNKLGNVEVHFE